jgi:hypothetical protein
MKLKFVLAVAASSMVLASCLKSKGLVAKLDGSVNSIVTEIWDVNYYGPEKVVSVEATPPTETTTLVTIKSYYPGSAKPSGNIQVTLTKGPDTDVTNAGFTVLPANGYSLPSLTFEVPKETGVFEFPITLNKANLDLSKTYGISLKLTSVSQGVISELAKEIIVAIVIKNAYHSEYDVTGYFFHPSAPREIDLVKELLTINATRSEASVLGDLSGWSFRFDVSGTNTLINWGAAGATPPAGQAGSSGFMTADNPGNTVYTPLAPGTAPWQHSTYNNTYNPATKTFWMHYGYVAGVVGGENTYTRQIYEKWVRH